MVPFTDSLLRACRKLAIKLEASMRFQGRVFLSEIGTPEHDYSHLIQLFGELSVKQLGLIAAAKYLHGTVDHTIWLQSSSINHSTSGTLQ